MRFLDAVNVFVTGRHYEVEDGWDSGIRYRLDHDGADTVDDVERAVVVEGHWIYAAAHDEPPHARPPPARHAAT